MDAVSAFGIAAGVAQFVTFGLSALKLCKEIRDDVKSATKHNRELEEAVRFTKDARGTLSTTNAGAGKKIGELAKLCAADAKDLLLLLEEVRDAPRSKPRPAVILLFKTMKNKRSIEKLENSLRAKETRLAELLIQDMHTTIQSRA